MADKMPEYKWGAVSPSDHNKVPMKFHSREQAQRHADAMSKLIETWDDPVSLWDKQYWKSKPDAWVVVSL